MSGKDDQKLILRWSLLLAMVLAAVFYLDKTPEREPFVSIETEPSRSFSASFIKRGSIGTAIPASCASSFLHGMGGYCSESGSWGAVCYSSANWCGQANQGWIQGNGSCATNLNAVYIYIDAGYGGVAYGTQHSASQNEGMGRIDWSSINLNGAASARVCGGTAYQQSGDYPNECVTFYGSDDNFTDNWYPSGATLNDNVYVIDSFTYPTVSTPSNSGCPSYQTYRVNVNQTMLVNAHGWCKFVTNSRSSDLFIPANTAAELNSFFNSNTSGLTITNC